MCGLVGAAGKLSFKEEKAFKELLFINSLRGRHSVGIAAIDTGNSLTLRKKAMDINDFLDAGPVQDIFRHQNRCLIGHNRFATKGSVNNYNAHPFAMDNIVGAHNGSLTNMKLLPDSEMFDVDSEAIFNAIDTIGVPETALKLHGAWALTWWDHRDQAIHMWRNEDRPLCYVYSEDRKCIFWASESWMLLGVLGRNGIKHTELFNVTPHNEFRIGIPLKEDVPISDIRVIPVKAFEPPVVHSTYNYSTNRYGGYSSGYEDQKPETPATAGTGNFAKKHLALVTTTKETGTNGGILVMGTKVKFVAIGIDNRTGQGLITVESAPRDIDTHKVLIFNVPNRLKELFKVRKSVVFEAKVCGANRKNDKTINYCIQGNSLRLIEDAGVSRPINLLNQAPESTIVIEGETLTRARFNQLYKGCTCATCGMDLEFISGHGNIYNQQLRALEMICVDCLDRELEITSNYIN